MLGGGLLTASNMPLLEEECRHAERLAGIGRLDSSGDLTTGLLDGSVVDGCATDDI